MVRHAEQGESDLIKHCTMIQMELDIGDVQRRHGRVL